MSINYDFILRTTYDKTAYRALAEASWQLFRKRKLQIQAYPVLIIVSLITTITFLYNWGSYSPGMTAGGFLFAAFCLSAIPLSSVTAKAKMCSTAVKDAKSRGDYPADIQFVFGKDTIHTTVGQQTAVVRYDKVSGFAALGDWRFLLFGELSYIFHRSAFTSPEELTRFEAYIIEKCGLPLLTLKGTGPQR